MRHVALSAPHARTRERALALYEITQGSCATRVGARNGRHPHTVLALGHACHERGPHALLLGRPARPSFGGLSRRGAPPPGRGPRLRLGRAWPAVMDRLTLAAPVRAGLLLWVVPLQRGPGAGVAPSG